MKIASVLSAFITVFFLNPHIAYSDSDKPIVASEVLIQVNRKLVPLTEAIQLRGFTFSNESNSIRILHDRKAIFNLRLGDQTSFNEGIQMIAPGSVRVNLTVKDTVKNARVFLDTNELCRTGNSGTCTRNQLYVDPGNHDIRVTTESASVRGKFALERSKNILCKGLHNLACTEK